MNQIDERKTYSTQRLDSLRQRLGKGNLFARHFDLCLYVTGSFGRLEAAPRSDVDVFFLHKGSFDQHGLTRVDKTLIDAEVINACRELEFPEFTKGGVYLDVHYIDDVLKHLGSPQDDALNYFTARMLLLTESKSLANELVYHKIIQDIIGAYFRDFHGHETNFQPIFLVNDIVRYWKTMCLNYEAKRNRENKTGLEKSKEHIKNFKLKFSRIITCFSFVAAVFAIKDNMTAESIFSICLDTPIQRLDKIAMKSAHCSDLVNTIKQEYDWFLEQTKGTDQEISAWIVERGERDIAFGRARRFGELIFDLLQELAGDQKTLRYLVV